MVAGDTSALPQGRNPATTLLTPHGQAGPPASPPGSTKPSPPCPGHKLAQAPSETSKCEHSRRQLGERWEKEDRSLAPRLGQGGHPEGPPQLSQHDAPPKAIHFPRRQTAVQRRQPSPAQPSTVPTELQALPSQPQAEKRGHGPRGLSSSGSARCHQCQVPPGGYGFHVASHQSCRRSSMESGAEYVIQKTGDGKSPPLLLMNPGPPEGLPRAEKQGVFCPDASPSHPGEPFTPSPELKGKTRRGAHSYNSCQMQLCSKASRDVDTGVAGLGGGGGVLATGGEEGGHSSPVIVGAPVSAYSLPFQDSSQYVIMLFSYFLPICFLH